MWSRDAVTASLPVRVAAMALLLAVAYGGALRAGVAWDDLEIISANPAIKTVARPWVFFTDPSSIGPFTDAWLSQYRPLRTLTYALEYAVFGGGVWGYHLVSLLLHALGAWSLGRLTMALFGRGGWLAAAIWLVHPVYSENVLSLAAQGNLLCVLLAMLAATWHLEWLDRGSAWRRAAGPAAALGSMLAYESGALTPALVLFAEIIWRRRHERARRSWVAGHLPFWVLLAAFVAVRQIVTAPIPREEWWGGSWGATLVMQLRLWTEGWRLTAIPVGMLVRYQPDDVPAWITPAVAVAFHLAILGYVAVAALKKRNRVPLLVVAWWYLAQAPTANVIVANLGYPFAPRFLFLALVLAVAAAAAPLARAAGRSPLVWVALLCAGLLAVLLDRQQSEVWQSGGSVFREMVRRKPDDFGAQFNLGGTALRSGDLVVAEEAFERASALNPKDGRPEYSLGRVTLAQGRPDRASARFRRSLEIERRQVEPRVRLAEIESAFHRWEAAIGWLSSIPEQARGSGPIRAWVELATAEATAGQGRCAEARRHAEAALAPSPRSSRTTFRVAAVLHRCGDAERARELFRLAAVEAGDEYFTMVGQMSVFP
jgi:protein O-mannosyl-transferase